MPWEDLIPFDRGPLPWAPQYRFHRTNLGGNPEARIALLGVYPTLTAVIRYADGSQRYNLPKEFEEESFLPGSASGAEIAENYFKKLGMKRTDVCIFDMMPYPFANTTCGKNGRSMWTNIERYCQAHDTTSPIRPRPDPDALLYECRSMPGNQERLIEYLNPGTRQILITLGNEFAAYVRGYTRAKDGQPHLYGQPERIQLFGTNILIVNLAHPGIVMKNSDWRKRHLDWCENTGRALIAGILNPPNANPQG